MTALRWKQLADDMDMRNPAIVAQLNATEVTATEFARHGIPALRSLRGPAAPAGAGWRGIPCVSWTNATACHRNGIGKYHAVRVAGILARMHRSDISVPELGDVPAFPLTSARVIELVQLAGSAMYATATFSRTDWKICCVSRYMPRARASPGIPGGQPRRSGSQECPVE